MSKVLEAPAYMIPCDECTVVLVDSRFEDVCNDCAGLHEGCLHEDWTIELVEVRNYRAAERAVCRDCGAVAEGMEFDEEMEDGFVVRMPVPVWD